MRRRDVLIGGGAVAIAALAGCVTRADNPNNSDGSDRTRTISVRGQGEVTAEPDIARFTAAIEASGEDADAVRNALRDRIDTLRDTLIDAGVDAEQITTSQLRIRAVRDRRDPPPREPDEDDNGETDTRTRYEGVHALAVEIDDVDRVGSIVDAAVDGGADRISGLHFGLSDDARASLREDALSLAIAAAVSEAEHIAAEVDATVVHVKHVDATDSHVVPFRQELDMADDGPATEIYPDDVVVRASVRVTVEIE